MMASQTSRIFASLSLTRRGVNPRLTSLRRFQWAGSSMSIIMGRGPLSGRMPPVLEKVDVSLDAAITAS